MCARRVIIISTNGILTFSKGCHTSFHPLLLLLLIHLLLLLPLLLLLHLLLPLLLLLALLLSLLLSMGKLVKWHL